MLAISKVKQTNGENPSTSPDFLMSLYCGINGITPPKIIATEHPQLIMLSMVNSGSSTPFIRLIVLPTIILLTLIFCLYYKVDKQCPGHP